LWPGGQPKAGPFCPVNNEQGKEFWIDSKKTMKRYKKILFLNFYWIVSTIFISHLAFPLTSQKSKVVENIDYLYMHIGLQMDYPLPENFRNEKLKFEGNFKRYISFTYRKASNDIRFKPLRPGSAVMIVKNQNNKILWRLHIDVQKNNLHKVAAEVRDLLIAIDGIEVKIYNKKVIIDGQVLLPKEMDRIKAVKAQYGSMVESLVTYSPEAQKKIAEIIEKEIGYPEVTVRYAHNRFLLEGCVSLEAERARAMGIANLYTQFDVSAVGKGGSRRQIAIVKNEIQVPCESEKKEEEDKEKKEEIKKLVQIVVHFVEMAKGFDKGFTFQWTPVIGDEGTVVTGAWGNDPSLYRGITANLSATVANFFPKLHWAKSFKFARVLHNSSLLVEDGQNGVINTATLTPNPVAEGGDRVTAQVTTNVTPEIVGDRDNLIRMTVVVTVSSNTSAGRNDRTISTKINVRDGSSAAIGGVVSSVLSRGYNDKKPDRVNALPIVNLYSAKNYQTSKAQFIVFITPLIKSSASAGVERIKRKFKLDE